MKLQISVQSGDWYDESRPEESISYIKSCGFEAVDFGLATIFKKTFDAENLTSFYDKSLEELFEHYTALKTSTEKQGISISQAHGLFPIYYPGEDVKNRYMLEVTKKMIAVCGFLGCKAIVVHPYSHPDLKKDEEHEINLIFYRQLIPTAKQYGVKVCLENLYNWRKKHIEGGCTDAGEACWYIDTLNAETEEDIFGFCLDVGHANMMGKNLYQYITTLGKRITVLHIHDNDGINDGHMMPYTQTSLPVDWEGFLRGLKEIEYDGPLAFETFLVTRQMPDEVEPEVLKLISAIGKYFRKRLESN